MLHTHFFLSDLQKTLRTLTTSVLSFLTRVLSSCSFQTKNTGQSACEQIGPKSAEMLAAQWFAVSDDIVRNLLTFLCIRFRFSCFTALGFESPCPHHVAADDISFAATFLQKSPLTHFVAAPFQTGPAIAGLRFGTPLRGGMSYRNRFCRLLRDMAGSWVRRRRRRAPYGHCAGLRFGSALRGGFVLWAVTAPPVRILY